ncbi:MAG: UDP-3-O-(3-hydroxymyristoyl)glucosamine N-acyltransferase [Betaproteobacteria bacterium]
MKGEVRKSFSLAELAERFGGEVLGDDATRIRQVAPLETAGPQELSFLANRKYQKLLASTRACAVILGEEASDATALPRIVCKNPYAYYARVAALVNPQALTDPGVHPQAAVHAGARIAPSAAVGACAVIEQGAQIGDGAVISANCFVGIGARIGKHTRLHANATVYHDCVIGDRVIIHSGAVIGADGFGMAMDEGRWLKIPQIGRVIIGDDVEVGANTAIDRGALDDTVIEEGVKLDNQIQIGHNCRIGAHTAVAGCVGIAGSTRIGSYCQLGGSAMISGHLTIADRVIISGGTLVAKSIAEPGTYTAVFPMSPHDDWLRNASLIRHLHEMTDRIRKLEKEIKKLEGK